MDISSDSTRCIFLLAGEASGDRIGADLMARLKDHPESGKLEFSGVGGAHMSAQGLVSLFPITDLSVMGMVDVVFRLPLLLWRVRQTIDHIIRTAPQLVVLIDSQVFSNLVAAGLKKRGFRSPILLYVSPTVWAYKPQRARKIAPLYDEVMAILPFEPEVMRSLGGPECSYVGHPAIQSYSCSGSDRGSRKSGRIILMPGSREGELRRHLPMFGKAAERLVAGFPGLEFAIITLPHLHDKISATCENWPFRVDVVSATEQREDWLSGAGLAICVAGTATLELAMARVPMVVSYVMDAAQKSVNRRLQVRRFSLPNLILEQDLVPELLMEKPDADLLAKRAADLLRDESGVQEQVDGFSLIYDSMKTGTPDFPRRDPAERVLFHLYGATLRQEGNP